MVKPFPAIYGIFSCSKIFQTAKSLFARNQSTLGVRVTITASENRLETADRL